MAADIKWCAVPLTPRHAQTLIVTNSHTSVLITLTSNFAKATKILSRSPINNYIYRKMKNKILLIFIIGLLSACFRNKVTVEPLNCDVHKVEISLDETFYDSIVSHISDTSFVILNEKGSVMFSYADKIIEHNNKYYILDKSSLRTVVSFKKDGSPVARYGSFGQGPGEYVFPWDMDIDETGVYVLDTNSKKIIHYTDSGILLSERKIPFFADAFKRLKNGNFIFNMTPDGTQIPSLIYTDSLMNPIKHSMPYQEGYVGGYTTNGIFTNNHLGLGFYRSPSDSLSILDKNGEVQAFIVFDFLDKAVPQIAKTDYLAFSSNNQTGDYLHLVNNPIGVSDSIWIGLIEDGHNQYTIIFNPFNNKCGCKKFTESSSVYDMIEPMFSDNKGTVVSLISQELEGRCRDYESLPDTIINALNDGNRVLLINKFHF